jgi:hypothetical protein
MLAKASVGIALISTVGLRQAFDEAASFPGVEVGIALISTVGLRRWRCRVEQNRSALVPFVAVFLIFYSQ